jgi:hypothetical protein
MAMTCIVGNVQPPPTYPLSACPRRLDMVRDHLRRDWVFFLDHQEPRKPVADPGWKPELPARNDVTRLSISAHDLMSTPMITRSLHKPPTRQDVRSDN